MNKDANKIAICAGSFDPPTDGHFNIIERSLKLFDKIIVAVAVNSNKESLFSPAERVEFLQEIFKDHEKISVDQFSDQLLVEYVQQKGANIILRGLRSVSDYEFEFQMNLANKKLAPNVETIFMMSESKYSHLSSTMLKEIIRLGGSGEGMIHPIVEQRLKEKLKG